MVGCAGGMPGSKAPRHREKIFFDGGIVALFNHITAAALQLFTFLAGSMMTVRSGCQPGPKLGTRERAEKLVGVFKNSFA